ncbi:MAG: hypothetical protein KDB53_16915, partial [Planctomycetes bacterium]|nr:hypothetical protein [Planctomycetota bacterium]
SEATCFSKGDDFEVVVEATFSARGRLRVSSSALLDQCELRFTSPRREYPITVKPGPDARFEVRDIPAGPCELEVRIGNLTAARVPFEIDADRPAAPPALQDIRVDESLGFVTIKVLGPDDQALAGVLVSIEEPDPERPNPESVGINRLGRTDGRGEATFVTRTNRGLTVDATPGPDLGPRLPRGVGEAPPARIRHRVQTFETLSSPLIVKLDYWPMLKIQIEPPPSSLTDERLELVLECDNQVIRPELVGASGLVWFDWVQGESCRLVLRRRVPHADPAAPSMGVEIGVIDLPTQGVIERELTLSPEQQEAIRALSK